MPCDVTRAFHTRHRTTVPEPAMTKFRHSFYYCLVPTVAAQHVAAPGSGIVFFTVPGHSAQAALAGLTELGTLVCVEEIVFRRRFHCRVGWDQPFAGVVRTDFRCRFVFLHEDVADCPEFW